MQSFSSEEISDFFRALHAKKPAGGRLNWQTMKAVMFTNIATRQMEVAKDKVKSEWLPASVWETLGQLKETIERQHVLQRATKTDQPRNPAASIWFKTNDEIRVLPVRTLQIQDVFLFRYQKVDQNQQFAFIA